MTTPVALIERIDGRIWAQAFVRRCRDEPGLCLDEDAVTDWFGRAIEAGYQRALADHRISQG